MRILPPFMAWCLGAGLAAASPAAIQVSAEKEATMPSTTAAADTQGLQNWLAAFRSRAEKAGISAPVLDQALTGLVYDADVIRRDRNQSEFTKTIWDYLDTAASDERVKNGKAALQKHAAVLAQIEAKYGVDKEVVTAIWGLESAFGSFRGSNRTLQSLATLAYDGRRAAFFEAELIAALKILQAGDTVPENMQGSWAGAMGHTQFMPSSFLAYAVDFNGDGKRDIWGDDPTDALASTAAYLAGYGWTKAAPWGVEITLPDGFDYEQTSERVKKPVDEWHALGVRRADGGVLPDHGAASVLLPGGARGAAFLIFSNFQVIERYNSADAYVIAVGHLADMLKGGARFKSEFPETGEDVKVMGIRVGDALSLTIAMPFLAGLIRTERNYFRLKERVHKELHRYVRGRPHRCKSVDVMLNALDRRGKGLEGMYLTLLGTSAEQGDSGQIGRGNQPCGVIPISRPTSGEAVAGKNPVSHVGKIYNVLAFQLAARIHREIAGVNEATVQLCSRIGSRIDRPAALAVQVSLAHRVSLSGVSNPIRQIVKESLQQIGTFCEELARGKYPVA